MKTCSCSTSHVPLPCPGICSDKLHTTSLLVQYYSSSHVREYLSSLPSALWYTSGIRYAHLHSWPPENGGVMMISGSISAYTERSSPTPLALTAHYAHAPSGCSVYMSQMLDVQVCIIFFVAKYKHIIYATLDNKQTQLCTHITQSFSVSSRLASLGRAHRLELNQWGECDDHRPCCSWTGC